MLDKEAGLLLDWKGSSLSVFLSVCRRCVRPQDAMKAFVVTDTDQSAPKTAIQNSHPVVVYKNTQDVMKGEGHCEVHHMEAKVSTQNEENVFACAFSTSCMSGRDLSDKLTFPFISLCLLVKREIAKIISLSLFSFPLSSLRERRGPLLEWECDPFLKCEKVFP